MEVCISNNKQIKSQFFFVDPKRKITCNAMIQNELQTLIFAGYIWRPIQITPSFNI